MAVKENKIKATFTLSKDLVAKLTEVTEIKGMAKSAYVAMSIYNQIQAEKTLQDLPEAIKSIRTLSDEIKKRNIEEFGINSDGTIAEDFR